MGRELHILNLGAGVQSTTCALLNHDEEFAVPTQSGLFDCAVFADTQEEPRGVYAHLDWLTSVVNFPIVIRTAGKLGDDLVAGRDSTGGRFASIPAFTLRPDGSEGITRRQCTREYKVEVIERFIRRELLGLNPRQRIPKDVHITQYMGFSVDEPGRAARAKDRFRELRWGDVEFPLWQEDIWMSRGDCLRYLDDRVAHDVPRSACVFCPYKSNAEWRRLREHDPEGWARAIEVDRALRTNGSVVNRKLDQPLFLHRSCKPLGLVKLEDRQGRLFEMECEGGCGL